MFVFFVGSDFTWSFDFSFLKALLFVMMDLTGEVSSGAVDMAKSNLEKMLVRTFLNPYSLTLVSFTFTTSSLQEFSLNLFSSYW